MKKIILLAVIVGSTLPGQDDKKPTVAVGAVEVQSQNINCTGWDAYTGNNCNSGIEGSLRSYIEHVVVNSDKFTVFNRGAGMTDALQEQVLAAGGLTDAGGNVGGMTSADYTINAQVVRFGAKQSGTNVKTGRFGGRFGRGQQASQNKVTVEMGILLKVMDNHTAQTLMSEEVAKEVVTGSAVQVGGFSQNDQEADPYADVIKLVATETVFAISRKVSPIQVLTQDEDGIYLNYGSAFLQPGDVLGVYATKLHPVKKTAMKGKLIGKIEVFEAESDYSAAHVLDGGIEEGALFEKIALPQSTQGGRKRSGGKI